MSDYINGKDLKAHWGKRGFELFGYLKKGLRIYNQNGQEIINADTLERGRKNPIEWYESELNRLVDLAHGEQETGKVVTRGGGFHRENPLLHLTDQEKKQQAKERYEKQPLELKDPPPHMSFTLPLDEKEASIVLFELNSLLFKKDEASEFAEQHGYPRLDSSTEMPVTHKEKDEDLTSPSPNVLDRAATEKEPEYESFVRSLRVFYENDSEIEVQTPGKPSKSLNLSILGFQGKEAVPWKDFLNILQSPDHTYSCGPSTLGKTHEARKNPKYSHRQKRLKSLSAKLIGGLNKVYQVGIPEKYSLFELVPGKQGTYKPKFNIEDRLGINPIEMQYDRCTEDQLREKIAKLYETYKKAYSQAEEHIAKSIFTKLVSAATVATNKGWLTKEGFSELVSLDGNAGSIPDIDLSRISSQKLLYGDDLQE